MVLWHRIIYASICKANIGASRSRTAIFGALFEKGIFSRSSASQIANVCFETRCRTIWRSSNYILSSLPYLSYLDHFNLRGVCCAIRFASRSAISAEAQKRGKFEVNEAYVAHCSYILWYLSIQTPSAEDQCRAIQRSGVVYTTIWQVVVYTTPFTTAYMDIGTRIDEHERGEVCNGCSGL